MSLWSRLALADAVLVIATAAVVGLLSFYNLRALVVPSALEQMQRDLRLASDPLPAIVETASRDVLVATATTAVAGILRATRNGGIDPQDGVTVDMWRERLSRFFASQLEVEPRYLQFRLIGVADGGREIVRVERAPTGEGVRIVPQQSLQKKGERPYFVQAIGESAGEIAVSPIELNEEGGQIEAPAKPVIRIATPVMAPDGQPFGILIINIDLRVIFAAMRTSAESSRAIYVANRTGELLLSPDPEGDFAFQRGGSALIQEAFPALSAAIAERREVAEVLENPEGEAFGVVLRPLDLAGSELIFVAETLPYGVMTAFAAAPQRSILLGALIAATCAVVLALLMARTITGPIRQMTRGAKAIERGEQPTFPTGAGGEIGKLARAFASMSTEVEEKRASLSRALEAQRQINAELRAASTRERLLSMAVDTSDDAIFIHDLNGRIETWNNAAERLYGYQAREMIGRKTEVIVPPDRHEEFNELLGKVRRGEKVHHFETVRVKKDGTPVDVALTISPVRDTDGKLIGASKIARDITERKRAEAEAANQTENLKRSNAELEQFAYIAAHDLQEPLRMVASYTELLSHRYKGQLDERADKYIAYAVDGAKRMKLLINDLLTFSRVGTMAKPLVPVDTKAIVSTVVAAMRETLLEAGATVVVGDLPTILGDDVQLGQLFQNLIGNAVKFRSEAAPHIEITARANGQSWLFSISDNGIGIDPQYGERIFQMFQRLHERGRYEGSGIGLSIAKKIAERHGGRIWFESQAGGGTTFYVSIPRSVSTLESVSIPQSVARPS